MSGPEPEPSLPASPDATSPPDSAPWTDTDLGLAPASAPARAPLPQKAPVATGQLSTIGHIGRYALKYQIGEGGLGRVFAAHDPLLSRLIAIKTLNVAVSAEERESFNALFLNEARAAGGLSHPHIVTVFDAGVSEQGPYIAMELLRGRDLRQLRLEGWRPTPMQAALVIRRVADALAYAHSKGVVHRDMKPANIFMVGRTQPRVLDFGIARVAHHHDVHGESDLVGGSPYYMSPEQIRQEPVDRRTDVYSLGVVLYELLTDVRPFRGSTLPEITCAVLEGLPTPAHEVDPTVPRALSDIAARAMQKNRDDRFSSARSLSRELRHWLDEHAQQDAAVPTATNNHKRMFAWAGGGVAALAVAGAAWWSLGAHGDDSNIPPGAAAAAAASAPASQAAAVASLPLVPAAVAADTVPSAPPPDTAPPASTPLPDAQASAAQAVAVNAVPPGNGPVTLPPDLPAVKLATATATAMTPRAQASETPTSPAKSAKETAKERRAREAREKAERAASGAPAITMGTVRIAVSPWGNVEVDGRPVGTAPPLNELNLPEGRHTVTIRNDEFPPFSATVNIVAGQPVNVKHRFGS